MKPAYHNLDIENWNRREHFEFFRRMEEPFFGITATVDCTIAYAKAQEAGVSFFVYYLHKTMIAVHTVPCFRYRIAEDAIRVYDRIDPSATIMRADHTFGFSLIVFDPDLTVFNAKAKAEMARIQETPGLFTRDFEANLVHFSALPWIDFTALSHARGFGFPDSCPKLSYGKMTDLNGVKTMPLSVHVHHGLVDGYDVGVFLEILQTELNR